MLVTKTKCRLDTCGCVLTIRYTHADDGGVIEELDSFHSKCPEHESLDDQAAFAAALAKARAINMTEPQE